MKSLHTVKECSTESGLCSGMRRSLTKTKSTKLILPTFSELYFIIERLTD